MLASATALLALALVALTADHALLLAATLGVAAFVAAAAVVLALLAALPRRSGIVAVSARRGLAPAQPEPSHPDTEGRARPRAPGRTIAAA